MYLQSRSLIRSFLTVHEINANKILLFIFKCNAELIGGVILPLNLKIIILAAILLIQDEVLQAPFRLA